MHYTVEWDDQLSTFKAKGLGGVKRKIWMLAFAKVTAEDGTMYIWDGSKLLLA